MVLYIELFLLDNFVMDCLLLRTASALVARPIRLRRMVLASLLGAFWSCIALFCPFLITLPAKIASGFLFAFAFPKSGLKEYACEVAAVFGAAFLTGGLAFCLAFCFGGEMQNGILIASLPVRTALVIALIATFIPNLVRRLRMQHANCNPQCYAKLSILVNGKEYQLNALIDTGNSLVEPISGKPVAVAYLPELANQAHIPIPAATAGSKSILYALRPECMRINGRESEGLLALSPMPLHGTAEALLSPGMAGWTNLGG